MKPDSVRCLLFCLINFIAKFNDGNHCGTGQLESGTRSEIHQRGIDQQVGEYGPEGAVDYQYQRFNFNTSKQIEAWKDNCKSGKCYWSKKFFDYTCGTNNPDDAKILEKGYVVPKKMGTGYLL